MNVNPASASYAQQYANNLQTTAQPTQQTEQNIQVQQAVPEEPSREARPVQEANESAVGRNVDVYI